jgi:hypothetical protein
MEPDGSLPCSQDPVTLNPNLRQLNTAQIITYSFFMINFNIILIC